MPCQSLKVNAEDWIGFAFAVGIRRCMSALGPASEELIGVQIWDPAVKVQGPLIADAMY